MPTKDSAELREAISVFEQGLVACGIDASNVDYDKLADVRHKLWGELDRITAAQVAASQTQVIDVIEELFKLVGPSDITKVLDAARKSIEADLTTGQNQQ